MSLSARLFPRLLGLGRVSINNQKWRIFLKFCIVHSVSKVYSKVVEFKV